VLGKKKKNHAGSAKPLPTLTKEKEPLSQQAQGVKKWKNYAGSAKPLPT
jgi:hypothetical protein